jgi:Protein of unknown function (DUF3237)
MVETRVSPHLEFALELRVNIGPVLELGWGSFGLRRMVPITGGSFRGPGISGRVLPGGADWQFVDRDGLTLVDAHYVIETADAVRIEVSNPGIRHGAQDVLDRIAASPFPPASTTSEQRHAFILPREGTTGSRDRSSWEMLSDMPTWWS